MKKILFVFTAVFAGAALCASEPVMRVGLLTDTHIRAKKESCKLIESAYSFFRKQNVDLVINAGDIANVYDVQAYRNYRETVETAYAGAEKRPAEIFAYANHDRIGREKESVWEVFKDVKKHLNIPNEPYDTIKLKGYTFVVVPQYIDMDKYAALLDAAAKENPGKPFFVIDHIPPRATVFRTNPVKEKKRLLLEKYPNAVVFCGHIHNTLRNERCIWQGEFTAVSLGSQHDWHIGLVGTVPPFFKSDTFAVLEIFKDKLVIRRYLANHKEFRADKPWTIPLPFDPKTAPYTIERKTAESTEPEFPANAEIKTEISDNGVTLSFPRSTYPEGVVRYMIELFRDDNGELRKISRQDITGDFMMDEPERKTPASHTVNPGFFDAGKKYRLKVTPVNLYGKRGKGLVTEFTAPEFAKPTLIFESKNPMQELEFKSGLAGGKPFKLDKDGFYIHDAYNGRLIFPENVWAGKRKTRFRFTVDMHLKQGIDVWSVVLRNPKPLKNANARIATESGDPGVQRFVIEFNKTNKNLNYYLLIREGGVGKIRFDYIKIERLDNK